MIRCVLPVEVREEDIQCQPDRPERKGSIEGIRVIIKQMMEMGGASRSSGKKRMDGKDTDNPT